MERKIIYLINPIAGTSKKQNTQKIIEDETSKQKLQFEIL